MNELEQEAKRAIEKIENTIAYHKKKFSQTHMPITQKEIDALEFVLQYAKEALAARGVNI